MSAEPSLGTYLRRGREQSGLSVDAISSASRIVPKLIRALEADRFDLLPAPVYVRGFIRAYCAQVGVDAEEALRRYEVRPAPPLEPVPPATPPRPPSRSWRPAVVSAAVLAALGITATFVLARGRQPDAAASRSPGPPVGPASVSAPPGAPAARVTPPAETRRDVGPAPASSAGVLAPAPPSPAGERVLVLRAVDTTWVRVAPEGAPVTEETLQPGAVREWRSVGHFRVSLGNAGGVEVELDGQRLATLGERGEVVHATLPDEARP